jgi:integrase
VLEVLRGIAVEKGERSLFAKNAATADVFIPMLAKLGRERAKDIRDRAILLFGLMSSLRRAEIVAVNIEDLKWIDEGIAVLVRRSKTDRAGVGRTLLVPRAENPELCPVRAMRAWLDLVGETRGPLFRSLWKTGRPRRTGRLPAEQVADIVKRVALAAGLDPVLFGGHSLRAGYVTQARRTGLSWEAIMEQTGHKKIETVKRYARDAIDSSRTSRVVEVMKSFEGPETPESLTRIVEEVVLRPSD